jgi:hypothetical protein
MFGRVRVWSRIDFGAVEISDEQLRRDFDFKDINGRLDYLVII